MGKRSNSMIAWQGSGVDDGLELRNRKPSSPSLNSASATKPTKPWFNGPENLHDTNRSNSMIAWQGSGVDDSLEAGNCNLVLEDGVNTNEYDTSSSNVSLSQFQAQYVRSNLIFDGDDDVDDILPDDALPTSGLIADDAFEVGSSDGPGETPFDPSESGVRPEGTPLPSLPPKSNVADLFMDIICRRE